MLDFYPQNRHYIIIYESITHHFGKRRIFKNGGETLETFETPILHEVVKIR